MNPIRRLQNDLTALRKHRKNAEQEKREVRADQKDIKRERKEIQTDRKRIDGWKKELVKDKKAGDAQHKKLDGLNSAKAKELAPLDAREAQLQDEFSTTTDPSRQAQIQAELAEIDQKQSQVGLRFDGRIADVSQKIVGLRKEISKDREHLAKWRAEAKEDHQQLAQEKKSLTKNRKQLGADRKRVKNARKRALSHLRAAEYKMGLKATNRVRKALGLKPVDHVIRPNTINPGKGWGGSEGVADTAKRVGARMGIPVTSTKRSATTSIGSSSTSDHHVSQTSAYAVDFGVAGPRGTALAKQIARAYGIKGDVVGNFNDHFVRAEGKTYRIQILWQVPNHFDHVHVGIRRV